MTEDHDAQGSRPEPDGAGPPTGPCADARRPRTDRRPAPGPARRRRRRPASPAPTEPTRRRWPWVGLHRRGRGRGGGLPVNLNYYALQPGTAQSVQQFITVPPDKGHPVTHPVLLTDVEIGRVTALSYLSSSSRATPPSNRWTSVTGGTPPSQLNAQGALEMSQAEADAKAAALTPPRATR